MNAFIAAFLFAAQAVSPHPVVGVLALRADSIPARSASAMAATPFGPEIAAWSAVAVDGASGAIVFGKRPQAVRPIASVTKLLTSLAVMRSSPRWGAPVVIIAEDIPAEGHTVLAAGDRVTVADLLTASLVYSDNAAAYALARVMASSRDGFLDRMRAIADELGLATVRVVDPAGLDPGNIASASDAARLALAAFAVPEIRDRAQLPEAVIRVSGRTVRILATDLIVRDRARTSFTVIGGKTGYLDESLYNLTLVARRGGRTVAVAVLGSPTHEERYRDARVIADWALRNNE